LISLDLRLLCDSRIKVHKVYFFDALKTIFAHLCANNWRFNMQEKKYALITGSSQGIGRALAEECARRGLHILMVALDTPELGATRTYLASTYPVEVHALGLDLTQATAPQQVFDWTQENKWTVNVLINNAGFGRGDRFEFIDLRVYQAMMRLNNQVMIELAYLFLPQLKSQAQSFLLNLGSMESILPMPNKAIYTATKHFMYAFSLSLREEAADTGLSVSILCPGPVLTNEDGLKRIKGGGLGAKMILMLPEQVAPIALKGLFSGKRVIVPGFMNKVLLGINSLLPLSLRMRLLRKIGQAALPDERKSKG
jgi:short-subunit dehydrogenase